MPPNLDARITLVSELLAACAIIASGYTYLYQIWWKDQRIELSATVASSTPKILSLLVTNTGGKDVAITAATVSTWVAREKDSYKLNIKAEGELVRKGESILLSPAPSNLSAVVQCAVKSRSSEISTTECLAEVEYVGPDSEQRSIKIPFQCYAACMVENREE